MEGGAELLGLSAKEGLFAMMFVVLFAWTLAQAVRREEKLLSRIELIDKALADLAKSFAESCKSLERVTQMQDAMRQTLAEMTILLNVLGEKLGKRKGGDGDGGGAS